MNTRSKTAVTTLLFAAALIGSACSGGGGGGGVASVALRVEATGQANPLWQGSPIAPPLCAATIGQNAEIIFTFGGPVAAGSLPQGGLAVGSIDIRTTNDIPAAGTFTVRDDPALPPGNARQVVFAAALPANPGEIGNVGFQAADTYVVRVGTPGLPPLIVGAGPLTNEIVTCFATCVPMMGPGCFVDPIPGPAFIAATVPATGDPAPAPIDPTTITEFTVMVNEPLNPGLIDPATVRLVNALSGAQVPGNVVFHQQGSAAAGPAGARIDYVPLAQLLPGVTYELIIGAQVQDLGANPLALYPPSAPDGQRRLFETIAEPFCPQPPIVEDFTSTQNAGSVAAVLLWEGTGELGIRAAQDVFGDGSFGPLFLGAGPGTLDTGMAATTGFADGEWNTTDFTVVAGANVRLIGALYQTHIRCTQSATIDGVLDGGAGTNPVAPVGDPEQGPGSGAFNNGSGFASSVVPGGVGGVGGGAGGRASQAGFSVRTARGEDGFGPPVNGAPNPGPVGANASYGGGGGGMGGFRFPSGGVMGELGGIGGAGGAAWEQSAEGRPFTSPFSGCQPLVPAIQSISPATPIPAIFVPPVFEASAGSGGGGGGDRFEVPGPQSDDQGGGGGGGGGGFRVSAIAGITVGATAVISCDGANGGMGNVFFGGGGGGGSGGQIWLQTPGDLDINASATLIVSAGTGTNLCSDHASGAGGAGLYQLEDGDGMFNTGFIGGTQGGANVVALPFPFGTVVSGSATSVFFDTGYGDPTFSPIGLVESLTPGTIVGATVAITYQGAHEQVSGGGVPDLTTLSPPVSGAMIAQLNGYRFIRFTVTLSYPGTPIPGPGATLPSVQSISIGYSAPVSCM